MTSGDFIVKAAFPDNVHAKNELRLTARQYGKLLKWSEDYGPSGPVGLTLLSLNQLGARSTHHAASAIKTGLAREPGITADDRTALEQLADFLFREAKNQGVTIVRDLAPKDGQTTAASPAKDDPFAKFRVKHGPQNQGALMGGAEQRPCRRETCGPRN